MRIPDDIRDCTFFLAERHGGTLLNGGTAFAVSWRHESVFFQYLVTAKHCVLYESKQRDLWARINKANGSIEMQLDGGWYFHSDPGVDLAVAVMPAVFMASIGAQYKQIPESDIATKEDVEAWAIGLGDEIAVPGLFSNHWGTARFLEPIVRSGTIAAMPKYPLDHDPQSVKYGLIGSYEAYLVEMRSVGGLSGSPVFAVLNPYNRAFGSDKTPVPKSEVRLWLIGIISGHWRGSAADITGTDFFSDQEYGLINKGIGYITPGHKLIEILASKPLEDMRREAIAQQHPE